MPSAPDKGHQSVIVSGVLESYAAELLHLFEKTAAIAGDAYDRGPPREAAVRSFFDSVLPRRYGIGEGYVIDTDGGQSEQCDVVVYDGERTPRFEGGGKRIWPFEGVYAVAQVKSTLTEGELESAVKNIASVKKLKRPDVTKSVFTGVTETPNMKLKLPQYAPVKVNQFMGMLIAHKIDAELVTGNEPSGLFKEIVASVPQAEQLDGYCVVTGLTGFRGTKTDEQNFALSLTGADWYTRDWGKGSLAAFLVTTLGILNGLEVECRNLLPYLVKYLPSP